MLKIVYIIYNEMPLWNYSRIMPTTTNNSICTIKPTGVAS